MTEPLPLVPPTVAGLFAADAPLARLLRFAAVCDRLKRVRRANVVDDLDGLRPETTAEHSWHLAVMAHALAGFAPDGTDLGHAVFLVLVHDLPEIIAGDTPAYLPPSGDKQAREAAAAQALFSALPAAEADRWLASWLEFERGTTPAARFARALDRLQPLLMHLSTSGATWRAHAVRASQVRARIASIEQDAPALWPVARAMVDEGVRRGWLREA